MNELQTITQLTKATGVTTRTLRYYERIGLLQSQRAEGYAYRMYDDEACTRLRQIIILRKLRVPLKQIAALLSDDGTVSAIDLFMQNINELDEEIASLRTIRDILQALVAKLKENAGLRLGAGLLSDKKILSFAAPLSLHKFTLRENQTMEELNKASETLSKLTDKDVRIVYLSPTAVAAFKGTGEGCEGTAGDAINKFAIENDLFTVKPDTRSFGFDCSEGKTGIGEPSHAYEVWVSIPDDMKVSAPLTKKQFAGGLYAAHILRSWDFQDWRWLAEWAGASKKYDYDSERQCLEETLNYRNMTLNPAFTQSDHQLDLLIPIKEKSA